VAHLLTNNCAKNYWNWTTTARDISGGWVVGLYFFNTVYIAQLLPINSNALPVWARGCCRISPPRFLAGCCNRQLNQGSFVLLYFRLSTFSDLYWVWLSVFSCTVLFVSISQVIGCEDRLRNDLYCVGWGVKLYSNQTKSALTSETVRTDRQYLRRSPKG